MPNAISYAENVFELQADIEALSTTSDVLEKVLEAQEKILKLPGELEKMLRDPAMAIDLPDTLVTVLGLAPYGIGTAIKTVDRIASETSDVILEQADLMGELDDAWSVPRTLVSVAQNLNTVNSTAIDGYQFLHDLRAEEATLLEQSLGAEEIWNGTALAARMTEFNTDAEAWFDTKDAVLNPLNEAVDLIEKTGEELEALVPDLSELEAVSDTVLDIFGPVKDAFVKIEESVCVIFTITPAIYVPPVTIPGTDIVITPGFTIPAVTVDVCKIINDIGSAVQAVQDFVEGAINDILNALGFDLFGAIDDLKDELLAPFQPIFDALAGLLDAFQPLIDIIEDAIADVEALFNEAIAAIEEATGLGPMFENRIAGDQGLDLDDDMTGTDAEDGMFGLSGNDKMAGLGGKDFMFGGAGNDDMEGGAKADEMFGSGGLDTMFGGYGKDFLDGGEDGDDLYGEVGRDILFGRAGDDMLDGDVGADMLDGGSGEDLLLGGGGEDDAHGGEGKDKVIGGGGDDDVSGGGGGDKVRGGGGNDYVLGGAGNDKVKGGVGEDIIDGGLGQDQLTGAADADVYLFETGDGDDRIKGFEDGLDKIYIVGVDFDDVTIKANKAGNALIRYGDGDTVRFDLASTLITEDDFIFTLA